MTAFSICRMASAYCHFICHIDFNRIAVDSKYEKQLSTTPFPIGWTFTYSCIIMSATHSSKAAGTKLWFELISTAY